MKVLQTRNALLDNNLKARVVPFSITKMHPPRALCADVCKVEWNIVHLSQQKGLAPRLYCSAQHAGKVAPRECLQTCTTHSCK